MKNKGIFNSVVLIICGLAIVICYFLFIFPIKNIDFLPQILSIVALVIGFIMIAVGVIVICIKKSGKKTVKKVKQIQISSKECEICGAVSDSDANGCCKYCGELLR